MKKLFYLAFCLTVVLSLGCATITYPTITDNDGNGVTVTNTNGKAHLVETAQTSQIVGGRRWEFISFVDQAAGGSQKLTAYNLELAASTSNFHSDTYCNPDWTGCAWFTNDYVPPAPCSFYTAGTHINFQCLQASPLGICFSSRPGECGRAIRSVRNLGASEITSILNMGVEQGPNLTFSINSGSTNLVLQNGVGSITNFKFIGNTEAVWNLNKGLVSLNAGTPNWASQMRQAANLFDGGFKEGTAQLTFGGVTRNINYAALKGDVYRQTLLRTGR